MIQTAIVLAGGFTALVMIALIRKMRAVQLPDRLSPDVLTRINTDYSELPQ
jgi:hypothetical protein